MKFHKLGNSKTHQHICVAGKYFVHGLTKTSRRGAEHLDGVTWIYYLLNLNRNTPMSSNLFHLNKINTIESATVSHKKERKQPTIQDVKQKETPGAGNQHG